MVPLPKRSSRRRVAWLRSRARWPQHATSSMRSNAKRIGDLEVTYWGHRATDEQYHVEQTKEINDRLAFDDFTSEGTSSGGIAIDAVESRVTRKPNIAGARIVAIMRLSSSCKLTVGQRKASGSLRPRSVEKLRYFPRRVKLPSNDSYGSSLSLLRSKPMPSHNCF